MLAAPSEVMSLAELYLGMPPCQTDLANMKKVDALLEAQRPSVEVYSSDGIIEREASGETLIHQIWNGDAARARANNPAIRFVFPKEGVVGWMDNLAIPRDAKDPGEREGLPRIHAATGEQRPLRQLHALQHRDHWERRVCSMRRCATRPNSMSPQRRRSCSRRPARSRRSSSSTGYGRA